MKKNSSVSSRLLAAVISEVLIEGLSLDEIRKLSALINLIYQNLITAIALCPYPKITPTTPTPVIPVDSIKKKDNKKD